MAQRKRLAGLKVAHAEQTMAQFGSLTGLRLLRQIRPDGRLRCALAPRAVCLARERAGRRRLFSCRLEGSRRGPSVRFANSSRTITAGKPRCCRTGPARVFLPLCRSRSSRNLRTGDFGSGHNDMSRVDRSHITDGRGRHIPVVRASLLGDPANTGSLRQIGINRVEFRRELEAISSAIHHLAPQHRRDPEKFYAERSELARRVQRLAEMCSMAR